MKQIKKFISTTRYTLRGYPYGFEKRNDIDIINYIAITNIKKSLNIQHIEIKNNSKHTISIGTIQIYLKSQGDPVKGYSKKSGEWEDVTSHTRHYDMISLYEYLSSEDFKNTSKSLSKNDDQALEAIHRTRLIDYNQAHKEIYKNITDNNLFNFGDKDTLWIQSETVTDSSPKFKVNDFPYIHLPHKEFKLFNNKGRVHRHILHWDTNGSPFQLPYALCHKKNDELQQEWLCLRTPIPSQPYDSHLLPLHPRARVIITSRLDWAEKLNQSAQQEDTTNWVTVAWPGMVGGESPFATDWTVLEGRDVVLTATSDEKDATRALDTYAAIINTISPTSLSFVDIPDTMLIESAGNFYSHLAANQIRPEEWQKEARRRYGIHLSLKTDNHTDAWTFQTPIAQELLKTEYIIQPFLPSECAFLLYGPPGGGKTWFALLIACSVGTGKLLLNRWPTQKKRVLIVAGEMVKGTIKRIETILNSPYFDRDNNTITLYPGQKSLNSNERINLEDKKWQQKLSTLIENHDLIILDNISSLSKSANNEKGWKHLESYIESLKRKHKTIIIVHHTSKNMLQQRGTSHREDYVDFALRIQKENNNTAMATFTKHRDDLTFGEGLTDFYIKWTSTDGTPHWQLLDDIQSEKVSLDIWEQAEIAGNLFHPLFLPKKQYDFMINFFTLISNGRDSLQNKDLAGITRLKRGTISNRVNALQQKGLITISGNNKRDTHFKLAEKGREAYSRWITNRKS